MASNNGSAGATSPPEGVNTPAVDVEMATDNPQPVPGTSREGGAASASGASAQPSKEELKRRRKEADKVKSPFRTGLSFLATYFIINPSA